MKLKRWFIQIRVNRLESVRIIASIEVLVNEVYSINLNTVFLNVMQVNVSFKYKWVAIKLST